METPQEMTYLLRALDEISGFADWENLTIDSIEESAPRQMMGGSASSKPTGRRILTVKLPYHVTDELVNMRREYLELEIARLDELREYAVEALSALDSAAGESTESTDST